MNDIQALHSIIEMLHRSEKLELIKTLMEGIKDIIPKNAVGFDILCFAYYKAKDYKKAIYFGELALGGASPEEAKAIRYNLGKCYLNANEAVKAKNAFSIVSNLDTSKVDIKLDLAAALFACNQKDEAKKLLLELDRDSWKLDPKDEKAVQFNLGVHHIRDGDFRLGMQALSLGRQLRIWGSYTHNFPIPEWTGENAPGKHVLIVGEGGIGDEIINARFVKHFNDRGMDASFASCQNLAGVFSRMPFEVTLNYKKLTTDIYNITDFDYWAPAMNLPKALDLDQEDLWYGPYITPNPIHNDKWKERLTGNFKVGMRWSGNPLYEQDLHRSISLEKLNQVIPQDWVRYSIQKENTEILNDYPNITNLESELETFEDAIACINNLDILITSCTSVAHAAAALGKRVFILTPIMDYYLWAEGKETSAWYGDNVTLIRQTEPKNWDSAFIELKDYLDRIQT